MRGEAQFPVSRASRSPNEAGAPTGLKSAAAQPPDIGDRDRARFHLAAIVQSAEDAIVSKNLQGIVQSWNPGAERLFGYRAEEMIGTSICRLLPPGREGEEVRILAGLSKGERFDHFESIRLRKDGSLVPVSLTISPVRNDEGVIIGASKIARDLTDQRKYESQASLVVQLQKALAEIKTLRGLIPICGYCKRIRDDAGFWNQVEDYLGAHIEVQFSHGICPGCLEAQQAKVVSLNPGPVDLVCTCAAGDDARLIDA